MLRKKQLIDANPKDPALEQRVDAMMDPNTVSQTPGAQAANNSESIDVFRDLGDKAGIPTTFLQQTKAVNQPKTIDIDDIDTDKAVAAIENQEDPEAVNSDAKGGFSVPKRPVAKKTRLPWLHSKLFWIILSLLLAAVFAVPFIRYAVIGLVVHEPITITVVDSKTQAVVSDAQVSFAGELATTDAVGKVVIKAPVGSRHAVVTKKYFTSADQAVFVGLSGSHAATVTLTATGHQIPVRVLNTLTGSPVSGVVISVGGTNARSDAKGLATIVLSAAGKDAKATLSSNGYNPANIDIKPSGSLLENTFKVTPAGKLYFLSNKSGTIDVVKTNLDGSSRATVLAGTGKEDAATTSLIASRDWKYLALKAKRDSDTPALYSIDTSTDKATQFESVASSVTFVGWYGHNLIYDGTKGVSNKWQAGREFIKSYNAESAQLNLLDQNQAEGTADSYAYQSFANFQVVENAITYTSSWTASGGYDISAKTASIRAMQPSGQGKKDYQTFPQANFGSLASVLFAPQGIYYALTTTDNTKTYYQYQDTGVTANTNIDAAAFAKSYPTYLLSPSGTQTLWADAMNKALTIGDNTAMRAKQVGHLNGYTPYGWYGESFVLVTLEDNNIYIVAPNDINSVKKPFKVSSYFKAATTYPGYGYGYGGL
jgi:hypothetical protein